MSAKHILTLGLLLSLLLLLTSLPARSWANTPEDLPAPGQPIWTNWDGQRYDLADDGQSIWIAAAGSIIEWDKQTETSRRITVFDGLPQADFFAAAVDPLGSRWFGGEAGLSRLDPTGVWTHYNSNNSDLPTNLIDDIAVTADGTLWLSHGLPDGAVSQWQPDGAIDVHPTREAAVVQAYDQVKETLNDNNMWTVFGDEIWLGYRVFDGVSWAERVPPNGGASEPVVRAASDAVYTLEPGAYDVHAWDGANWSSYYLDTAYKSAGRTLATGPDDSAWVAWFLQYTPYTIGGYGVSRLPEEPGDIQMEHYISDPFAPPSALLATDEGLWGVGAGWLLQPDWSVSRGVDGPASDNVARAILTTGPTLFVHSGRYIQTLDDQGSTLLDDDEWATSGFVAENVTAVERSPGGDVWFAGYSYGHFYYDDTYRYHQGRWINFPIFTEFPLMTVAYDVFAENSQVSWFAYGDVYGYGGARGVKRLDDGGTPADFSDDVWTDYPIDSEGLLQSLAVDSLGRIWAANYYRLYLYDGNAWQLFFEPANGSICDLVPAADGTLFVQLLLDCSRSNNDGSQSTQYLVIRPNGQTEHKALDTLIREEFDRISSTTHRNRLWTIAPDGAVWYFVANPSRLARYDGAQTSYFDLPLDFFTYAVDPFEVDENNHVWLANNGLLWRLSLMPDFALSPDTVLLSPGSTRHRSIAVRSIGGYSGSITLQLTGLPPGITPAFQTNPIATGEATQLTLTVDSTVRFGTYTATLAGDDGANTHIAPLTLLVVPAVHDAYFPLTAHP